MKDKKVWTVFRHVRNDTGTMTRPPHPLRLPERQEVLLVFPPGGFFGSYWPHFDYGLGAGYLTGYLAEQGVAVSALVSPTPLSAAGCARILAEASPRMIGFTAFHTNYSQDVPTGHRGGWVCGSGGPGTLPFSRREK